MKIMTACVEKVGESVQNDARKIIGRNNATHLYNEPYQECYSTAFEQSAKRDQTEFGKIE